MMNKKGEPLSAPLLGIILLVIVALIIIFVLYNFTDLFKKNADALSSCGVPGVGTGECKAGCDPVTETGFKGYSCPTKKEKGMSEEEITENKKKVYCCITLSEELSK
ncbi:MAG: hypothetical protein KKB65_01385 [Nanoarchaeota archaeon]|nr:hypothetical protein [Nanoarchaeota archaeon]MBU1029862.1 hypothetical protein [Nanoarchaeota archaeon]MBU1849288.1 hypothetical protein [Nanoarchaeota archaeon]